MKYLSDEQKKKIVGERYHYYDYTEETIKKIAEKPLGELTYEDGATIVQAIYPDKLICSGLFDNFLIFECHNGQRKDPPMLAFRYLDDKQLLDAIFDLFETNKIKCHEIWFQRRKNEK